MALKLLNEGIDHVEFVVRDLAQLGEVYRKLGFEKVGSRNLSARGIRSDLWAQGGVRILLTQTETGAGAVEKEYSRQFIDRQDEGVCALALEVENVEETFQDTVNRGARPALQPVEYSTAEGSVKRAEIWTPGNFRYCFIERKVNGDAGGKALFDEGLVVDRLRSPSPLHFTRIDHLTNNVDMGEMQKWVDWYDKVFDFVMTRHFDISTGRTGLTSDVVQSSDGKIIVPINEATEKESQVQEFVERLKGPGVQHLALETTDILSSLQQMKKVGMKFLQIPHTYYEDVPRRVKGVEEDMGVLEELQILVDGEREGYLLQIFTEEILGPFFFEYIQRKGDDGFGEGNFKALFEAIERDQIERGVLNA